MKKTFYACDLCENEVKGEDNLYDSKVGEVCDRCLAKVTKVYQKAYEEFERRNNFSVKNRIAITALLDRVGKDKWKSLFGTEGVKVMENYISEANDVEKYKKATE